MTTCAQLCCKAFAYALSLSLKSSQLALVSARPRTAPPRALAPLELLPPLRDPPQHLAADLWTCEAPEALGALADEVDGGGVRVEDEVGRERDAVPREERDEERDARDGEARCGRDVLRGRARGGASVGLVVVRRSGPRE